MRDIKFRAWDYSKKLIYRFSLEEVMDYEILDGYNYDAIMQYTGLTDKNGVEIYEGDILSQPYCNIIFPTFGQNYIGKNEGVDIGAVIWAYDCWRIEDAKNENLISIVSQCEVIGNIYENKELLEQHYWSHNETH